MMERMVAMMAPRVISAATLDPTFCALMMEDSPLLSHLFGLELGDLCYGAGNYDLENDFHGIYVLYGWVGLALLAAFFLYFVGLILWALLKNAKKYGKLPLKKDRLMQKR